VTSWLHPNKPDPVWSLSAIAPIPGRPLLAHVQDLLPPSGRGPLPDGGEPLPDEPPHDPSKVHFGGGSLDGIMSVGGGRGDGNEPLAAASAVISLTRTTPPSTNGVHVAVSAIAAFEGPHAMDRFLQAIRRGGSVSRTRVAGIGRWLCEHGVTRQQAKAGLGLLGISGQPDDAALISQLGLLEELTLYSAVALKNLLPDADPALYDLAQQVSGWGRIHCIYRLKDSALPEVGYWLLHGGYQNDVLTEEVAYIAATAGDLRAALDSEPDDEILDHAGALLEALACGGPAQDMTSYSCGEAVLASYLTRMATAAASLERAGHLCTVDRYLHGWAGDNPLLSAAALEQLRSQIEQILAEPRWRGPVQGGLASDDLREVRNGLAIARRFGLDPIPVARAWITREPHDGYLWQTLVTAASRDQMAALVQLAETLLPFSALPAGPARDPGTGADFTANSCFELILQRLKDFPGLGGPAVAIGLDARVTRTRHMALRVLAEWPRDTWPEATVETIQATAWRDPDNRVKKRARAILDSKPLD
jgi:hypothetical protein